MRQTLIAIGLQPYYESYLSVGEHIKRLGLSTDHWQGQSSRRGQYSSWISDEDWFVQGKKRNTTTSRKRLTILRGDRCEGCGLHLWQDKPLVLHVHHVDGDGHNNLLGNLQLLCPNCHQQTENWGFKNRTHASVEKLANSQACVPVTYPE